MINKLATPKQLQQILQILLQQPIQQQKEIASILQKQEETEEQKLRQILLQIVREQQTKKGQQQQEILRIIRSSQQNAQKVDAIVQAFQNLQEPTIRRTILQILQNPNLTVNGQVNGIVQAFSDLEEPITRTILQNTNLTVNDKVNGIVQAFPDLQEQTIRKILQNPNLTVNDKVNGIVQAFQDLQKPKIQTILQNPNLTVNKKVNKIVQAFSDLQKPRIQTILQYPNQNLNVNDKVNLIFQTFQNLQDQRTLEIFKILLLLETKITDDAINEVDSVIKSLVREINSSKNFRDIQTINQKLDKLMDLKKVLHENSNAVNRDRDDQGKELITNAARYLYLLGNSTQSLDKGKIHDPALGLELFRTYRSTIEYEGTLLNQRVNWFLVTQGFLFAAFATALSTEISFPILCFLLIISITGFGYSSLISNPISLSLFAVDTIKEEWNKRLTAELITDQVKNLIPKQVCFDKEDPDKDIQDYVKTVKTSYPLPPISKRYKHYIRLIPFGTKIIWLILLLFVINSLRSHPSYPTWLFGKNSHYLTIENPTIIEDRDNINEEKLGLKAAICLTKYKDQDGKDKYKQVLAIKPTGNLFFNLSQISADEYIGSVTVPVLRKNDEGNDETKKLTLTREEGKLESCE